MTGESDPKPRVEKTEIEITADEDWKTKVKQEDAKLDAELTQKHEQKESGASSRAETKTTVDAAQLPPPGIDSIMQLFITQAMVALGVVPDPDGNLQKQLPLARHFIDLLAVLEEKTKGNLDRQESNLLTSALHELRMAYVEQTRKGS